MLIGNKTVIIHSSRSLGRYFRSTNHMQRIESYEKYPAGYVPVTFSLPHRVVPRTTLPTGVVETEQDLITIYFADAIEIPNPDPKFQPAR